MTAQRKCGARCRGPRAGRTCEAPGNGRGGRCKLHGGRSTGPTTPEGAERARAGARRGGRVTAQRRAAARASTRREAPRRRRSRRCSAEVWHQTRARHGVAVEVSDPTHASRGRRGLRAKRARRGVAVDLLGAEQHPLPLAGFTRVHRVRTRASRGRQWHPTRARHGVGGATDTTSPSAASARIFRGVPCARSCASWGRRPASARVLMRPASRATTRPR